MIFTFDRKDISRDACMLRGKLRRQGYDWWWHSFTAYNHETGEEKPFFIEYFLCNPDLAEDEPVLGQLPENKEQGKKPSYLMVKAGCWGKNARQIHRFFAWKDVSIRMNAPYFIEADDCFASDVRLTGSVDMSVEEAKDHPEYMSDAGSMSWTLTVNKQVPFNVGYGAGKVLRDIKAFEMYWHAEGMKSTYSGKIMLDGVQYDVIPEKSYGYADKNWGSNFTSPWVWLSSNNIISRKTGNKLTNSVFDIGGGRPKVYFVPLERILLGAFYYEGKPIEFNFSKPVTSKSNTWFECYETKKEIIWHVKQTNRHYEMLVNIHCNKEDMILVKYESPDGEKRHNRLWNGGNGHGRIKIYEKTKSGRVLLDDMDVFNVGCEYGEYCEPDNN